MKAAIRLLTAILFISVICSCNHSNTLGKMIPKNALVIVHVNGRALSTKLSWEDIKQSDWYTKLTADSSGQAWMKKALQDPESTGIDSKGEMVFFILKGNSNDGQFVVEGDIKDEKNFSTFCKTLSTDNSDNKQDGLSTLALKENGAVAWNNKKFVFVFDKQLPKMKNDSNMTVRVGNNITDMVGLCRNMFSLKEDSSMRNNNNFTTLLNESADMHIWQNNEEILKNGPSLGMLGMLKLDVFIKNNVSAYAINFENGKIDIKQSWYTSKELMNVLTKYGGGNINNQMIKNIPTQNINALVSLHFKPQGIAEILKLTGMDGMLNIFMAQAGFNLDDFVAANKGDLLFVASDLVIKKDSTSDTTNRYNPEAKYLFAVSIGDKASFNKILNGAKKLQDHMKIDSVGKKFPTTSLSYKMNDNFFIAGNDSTNINKYSQGGNNNFTFLDEIKEHPIAVYVDLAKIVGNIAAANKNDTATSPLLNANAKMWDKILATGGNISDDAMHMHTVITLIDKSTNSLKQLNGLLNLVSKLHHNHKWNFKSDKEKADSSHRTYMDSSTVK